MNSRKDFTMTLAKYTAYTGMILVVFFDKKSTFIEAVMICVFLMTVGSLRQFVLEGKLEPLKKYTFTMDICLVTILGLLNYSNIFVIGYYMIIIEGTLLCPYLMGAGISVATAAAFFGVRFMENEFILTKSIGIDLVFTILSFAFFFFISGSTKRQLDQKEKLLFTIDKLEKSKEDLEFAYESLIQGNRKLQEVAVLEERNRVAREIHDTLAHTLTTIIVEIEAGMKLMNKAAYVNSNAAEAAKEELQKAQNQARVGLDEVRYSIKNLRSGVLNKEGFLGALQMTLEQLRAHSGAEITLDIAQEIELDDEYEMALFRIIQESATNSFRHGKSQHVSITLVLLEGMLQLEVADDGIGCEQVQAGYGIIGIRERVKKLGGSVVTESAVGAGFKITVLMPYDLITESAVEVQEVGQDKDIDR